MLDKNERPVKVYFEVTNYCNFSCDFCPIEDSVRCKKHMDFSLYQKGIDEIVRDGITDTVGFHILGEPMMYPQIFEAIRYAGQNGLRTEMNTNGSLLTTIRARQLAQAGLDQLSISVQVLDEKEHECRGTNISFEKYYSRIMDAVQVIRESGSDMELVLCFMNKSSKKYFDVDKNIRMSWEKNGNRSILTSYIWDICNAVKMDVPEATINKALGKLNLNIPQTLHIDENTRVYVHPFADWGNAFTQRKVYPAKFGYCGYALSNVGVLSNGQVTICCPDFDGKTTLGNLNERSLESMLTSLQAQDIREGFEKNRIVHPYCQRCIGSTNPTKAMFKGLLSIYLFKMEKFQPARVKEMPLI